MRQVSVIASICLFAIRNNLSRLSKDHARAQRTGDSELISNGFFLQRNGQIDTNVVCFGLLENSLVTKEELGTRLKEECGVKIAGGCSKGGKLFA
jgi:hypothetical protein